MVHDKYHEAKQGKKRYCVITGVTGTNIELNDYEDAFDDPTIQSIVKNYDSIKNIMSDLMDSDKNITWSEMKDNVPLSDITNCFPGTSGWVQKKHIYTNNDNIVFVIDESSFNDAIMGTFKTMKSLPVGGHAHIESINADGSGDKSLSKAVINKMKDEGIYDTPTDRMLVVVFNSSKQFETSTASRVSSKSMTASRSAAIKLAVAADHVKGRGFTSAKALASKGDPTHPLVAAVNRLSVGASASEVERVLDIAKTSSHAVEEVKAAVKMSHAVGHKAFAHYPGGVAMRLVESDRSGTVTAALADVL